MVYQKGIAMKYYATRHRYLIAATVVLLLLVAVTGATAFAQELEPPAPHLAIVSINSPAEGETISGIITVTGTVDFPDFVKYELFLKTGDQLLWGATVYAPVINGNLAFLDTKAFADGTYQLVTRQVHSDSNYDDTLGPTITIDNGLGSPQEPEVESSPLYPPVAGTLLRVRNCSGFNMEFDYVSPQGFCSFDNLWIMPKLQDMPLCTSVDILLIPDCEYRGTVGAEDDKARGSRYEFFAELGDIWELNYPGGDRIFLNKIKGDARAETDTGGLDLKDPVRIESLMNVAGYPVPEAPMSVVPVAPAPVPAATAEAPEEAPAPAPTDSSSESTEEPEALLPVSGEANETTMPFAVVAAGLILLMVVGGLVAIFRGKRSTA